MQQPACRTTRLSVQCTFSMGCHFEVTLIIHCSLCMPFTSRSMGSWGPVCHTHPVYPPDMPIGPILVSGWTGWVDGSRPQDHCLKGIQHQRWWSCLSAAPYPTQQATGPAAGPEIATGWFLRCILGMKVCVGACLDGRTTPEWTLSNLGHVMGLCV